MAMAKRFELRSEEIVEPELVIVDSHHHLFQRPEITYLASEYLDDARCGHNIEASVYVETLSMANSHGHEAASLDPVGEVEFAKREGWTRMCDAGTSTRVAAAIVGYADLTQGRAVGDLLDRCLQVAPDQFRGVRQIIMDAPSASVWKSFGSKPLPAGLMRHPKFSAGLFELASRGLSFDAAVFDHQLAELATLADKHSNLAIVVDHLGVALNMGGGAVGLAEAFSRWKVGLSEVAKRENVHCKIGGLGLPFWGFGLEKREGPVSGRELGEIWRPYVEWALEVFGPDRCMAESNFPADGRSCGFVPAWNGLKMATSSLTTEEKSRVFAESARRFYRMSGAEPLKDSEVSI